MTNLKFEATENKIVDLTDYLRYRTGFTSGALLTKEAMAAITSLNSLTDFLSGLEEIDADELAINSESSRKRIKSELELRLRNIESEHLLSLITSPNELQSDVILFYAACKTYRLLSDFMLEEVLPKWQRFDKELTTFDFVHFVYQKMDSVSELEEITEVTIRKLAQVAIKMLKQLGLMYRNKLTSLPLEFSDAAIEIVRLGDSWFLDALLLTENEKRKVLNL